MINPQASFSLIFLPAVVIPAQTAIAAIAREGQGQMSGYADVLGTDGDQLLAEWVLIQAQNAWTQG